MLNFHISRPHWRIFSVITVVACMMFAADVARAQCEGPWQSMGGVPGIDREIRAMTYWDPDGAGPLKQVLVVGGFFKTAGDVVAESIAMWNGSQWQAIGQGFPIPIVEFQPRRVKALATLLDGTLVAGGYFGPSANNISRSIAKWNGTSWAPLGPVSTTSIQVSALAVLPNGDLIAGGIFQSIGGVAANNIARWDGAAWYPMGAGVSGRVNALCVLDHGDLIVGGAITSAGGQPSANIARWDGESWHALGSGITGNSAEVFALAQDNNGAVIAAGSFDVAGATAVTDIAIWSRGQWKALGEPLDEADFRSLCVLDNGDVVAGGLTDGGPSPPISMRLARWDGERWNSFGAGLSSWPPVDDTNYPAAYSLIKTPEGGFVVGGLFSTADTTGVASIAKWDGQQWLPMGSGLNNSIGEIWTRRNGSVVISGSFTHVGDVSAKGAAMWDGYQWSALSRIDDQVTLDNTNRVQFLRELASGELVAVGTFILASGEYRRALVQWNGQTWNRISDLVPYLELPVQRSNGQIYASVSIANSDFFIARLDGTSWTQLTSPTGTSWYEAMIALPDGDLLVSYYNPSTVGEPHYVLRGDGLTWTTLGSAFNGPVTKFRPLPNGDILAVGSFSTVGGVPCNRVARWNGQSWQPISPAPPSSMTITDILVRSNGQWIAAGGGYVGSSGWVPQMARFDGQSWAAMPVNLGGGLDFIRIWGGLVELEDGDVMISGSFTTLSGRVSGYLARYTFDCCTANLDTAGSSASVVDVQDILAVITHWGPCPKPCPPACFADLSQMPGSSCRVDVADLLAVIASWGVCP